MNGVFDFHHFHSTSHEVLGVVAGSAVGAGRAAGRELLGLCRRRARPACGTGHRRASARDGFTVVGAYPAGQEDYGLLREVDDAARERIAGLPAPPEDPVGGDGVAGWG